MTINGIEFDGKLVEAFRAGQTTKSDFLAVLERLEKGELARVASAPDVATLQEIQHNVKYIGRLKDFFDKLLTPKEK